MGAETIEREPGARNGLPEVRQVRRNPPLRRSLCRAVAMALAVIPLYARAQTTYFEPSLGAELLWTDNASYLTSDAAQKDTIFTLFGDIAFRRMGPRLSLFGSAGFSAVEYLQNTQRDRVLPRADINATFEAVDDFFFIDAGVLVTQTPEDIFGVRPDASSTVNKVTTTQYSIAPHFKGQLSENFSYQLRSDNTWTASSQSTSGTTLDDGYFGKHAFRVERTPVPLGGFLSFDSNTTEYENQAEPVLRDNIARFGLNLAFTPQLSFGVRGGVEKAEGVIEEVDDRFYGVQMEWHPTDRTTMAGFYEERFFGNSWNLRFSHRMPRVAWDLTSSRDISTFPELLLTLPSSSNVSALLDAALTTRIPDANERARAVREVLNSTGLPSSIAGPTNLYTNRVLIVNRTAATVTLLGVRNTLGFSAYYVQNRDLADQVASIIAADTSFENNNRQRGGAITYSLRMSSTTSFNLTGDWNRTRGVDENSAAESTQETIRAQVSHQLGPKTSAVFGVRYLNFESNVDVDSRENAIFIAVGHRF